MNQHLQNALSHSRKAGRRIYLIIGAHKVHLVWDRPDLDQYIEVEPDGAATRVTWSWTNEGKVERRETAQIA